MTTTHPVAINKQYQSNSHHHAYMAAYITKALYKQQLTLSTMLQSVIMSVSEMKQQRGRKICPRLHSKRREKFKSLRLSSWYCFVHVVADSTLVCGWSFVFIAIAFAVPVDREN